MIQTLIAYQNSWRSRKRQGQFQHSFGSGFSSAALTSSSPTDTTATLTHALVGSDTPLSSAASDQVHNMTSYVLWMMSGDGLAFEIRSGVGVKLHCIIIMA